nr:ATP-grasp domain-containing protein [Acidimicrobiia bacterium]
MPGATVITRIAIVNRGEPAVRLARAVREWNRERGADVRVVALATPAERTAMFVRYADEAVTIAPRDGGAANPYLDLDVLRDALVAAKADAAWVGWGFVAERPDFAELCVELGVTFIGPPADVMRRLGDKIGSKLLAERAGVPMAPWSGGPVDTIEQARAHGQRIGYPLVVKATAGGGGRGIRFVAREDELAPAIESARGEARRSFGDGTVFMEGLVEDARHVEVQIVADGAGTVWALGVRDCSVQRRRQKVLEESSSLVLDATTEQALRASAVRLARLAGYRNAGTFEFLYQPETGTAAFLEVNTRLQVEHPVTEETTGVDIVKLQLHIADGGTLSGDPPPPSGHAIEARLNAEDPDRGFAPAPGVVEHLVLPSGPGIRVDSGVATGDVIPPEYDSMIAKIIALGRDRDEALARLGRALSETVVVIRGGSTNKSFLLHLLDQAEVRDGSASTGWLDEFTDSSPAGTTAGSTNAAVAVVAAVVELAKRQEMLDQTAFFAMAARGRPQTRVDVGQRIEVRAAGRALRADVHRIGAHRFEVSVGDATGDGPAASVVVDAEEVGPYLSRVTVGDRSSRVVTSFDGVDTLVEVDGVAHRITRDEGGLVRAPAPGLVVAVPVTAGDEVATGATVAVLEAMKMETAVTTPIAGRVRDVLVAANVQVAGGAPLVRVDAADEDDADRHGDVAEAIDLGKLAARSVLVPRPPVDELRAVLLGYEYDAAARRAVLARYRAAVPATRPDAEILLLDLFADLSALSRNRRADDADDETAHNEREHFLTYLGSLDVGRQRVPATFEAKLRRALAQFGVTSLDRTPELESALYRLYLALERAAANVPVIEAVLGRLATAPPTDALRAALDRLTVATQLRFPALGAHVRTMRFAMFDEPLLAQRRDDAYERVLYLLDALDRGDAAVDRHAALDELETCPYPLLGLLPARLEVQGDRPEPLLEAILRRYYTAHGLADVRPSMGDGIEVVTARMTVPHGDVAIIAVAALDADLDRAVSVLKGRGDASSPTVGEVFVAGTEGLDDLDGLDTRARAALEGVGTAGLSRVAFSFVDHTGATWTTLNYVPDAHGAMREQSTVRGIHPMIDERLHLWRLAEFAVERAASASEVVVLRCVALSNPTDERLVVLAEAREFTVVRDAAGDVVALPELEHLLGVAVAELRDAQQAAPLGASPDWNRIVIHLWPDVTVPLAELAGVVSRLALLTVGVGLEQVLVYGRLVSPDGAANDVVVRVANQPGAGVSLAVTPPPTEPMRARDDYARNVGRARQRGAVYPFEIVPMITQVPGRPAGSFTELDLAAEDALTLVEAGRPGGENRAGIVVGLATTPTASHPDGMTRVVLLGDPLKALGSLAEPECRRIIGALELAAARALPVEWFALSAGAKISMDSGTENMDWIARALRAIVEFTQGGGEINVVVAGINVGAQPYWNAEATMLMHTKGILVMTPDGAMVLTGKHALDYSGGVSAEDNFGIGGYDRIMGPNGQAQYWAADLAGACRILFEHYDHAYVGAGE